VKIIFLLLYGITGVYASAQPGLEPAPYTRISSYDTARGSIFVNPARLATAKTLSLGLYTEQRFLLPELSFCQIAAVIPVAPGSFNISGSWLGNPDYHFSQLGLGYGRSLGNRVQLGVRFNYARQHTAGYLKAGTLNATVGTLFRITGQLHMGIQAEQSFPKHLSGGPSVYCLAFGFRPSAALLVMAELTRKESLPLSFHTAIRYRFDPRILASLGMDTASEAFYIGGGLLLGRLEVEAISSFHPLLGLSPALLISFRQP
jgi:hypothetical protein